ncbi:hypothetical protein [Leptospira noguchii]|uniref:hypothetical protein n=1 Tax=Leptospira noguchii TaxID=28182 RepID=UPI0007749F48|nr:hypothetical protein [Leptospira noguchii]
MKISKLKIYGDLEILFVLKTLEWTFDSIKTALKDTSTLKKQSISFFVTPGHDEYSIFIMDSKNE